MGSRRKARECALQMLFAADFADAVPEEVLKTYWAELDDSETEDTAREFATRLAAGTLVHLEALDERIRSRAEHWRIPRMAIVDRNILRLAVYEFLYEPTPRTVAINGILDAIKRDLDEQQPQQDIPPDESGHSPDDEREHSTDDESSVFPA